jgi:LmbE family N-acetylglucosaminyl deacetylase
VVSPHLDDAALSCAALLDREEPLDILTVFTGVTDHPLQSGWDKLTGFSSSLESMAARREENRRAFQDSGHRLHYLDLLEREYAPQPRPASDRNAIVAAVRQWMEGVGTGVVTLPAGAGSRSRWRFKLNRRIGREAGRLQHPDHIFVRDAALDALAGTGCDVLLYEEVPYLFSRAADSAVASLESRIGVGSIARSTEIDRLRKANRIAAYRSQLPYLCPNGLRLDVPDSLPLIERYWRLTHA